MSISIVDQPYQSYEDNGNVIRRNLVPNNDNPDQLGTGKYAESLSYFIMNCDTPITIGVQGEWGSGKTSLLNMIKEDIDESEKKYYKQVLKGKDVYKSIWINTWEHSLLKTPEQCLVSIVEEIIEKITEADGSWEKAQRAKKALSTLAKGALRITAGLALGDKASQVAEEIISGNSNSNVVKELRATLDDIIDSVVNKAENPVERFVIFIDDLDRLDPSVAVQVLELLKNIFTVKHCVFVLAIDYQVVVKGLKSKFGEPTNENEWEFRAFFDKIIQLPFMMPMARYDLNKYINTLLISKIEYIKPSDQKVIGDGRLAKIIKLSLGHNPRSMKRLLNSLSLIKIQNSSELQNDSDTRLRQLIFALVCIQITFPRVYELLLRKPDFTQWDDEFVNKVTGGPHEENEEIASALDKACQVHEEDFDEDWEQSLFKILWIKDWQRKRLPEISKLLSEIKDKILLNVDDKQFSNLLIKALDMTAVTAVSSTEEGILGERDSHDSEIVLSKIHYWESFVKYFSGSNTVFDTQKIAIKSNISSDSLSRKVPFDEFDLLFIVSCQTTSFFKISFYDDNQYSMNFFDYLMQNKSSLEKIAGVKIKVISGRKTLKPAFIFLPPDDIPSRKDLSDVDNINYKKVLFEWLRDVLPKIESKITNYYNGFTSIN